MKLKVGGYAVSLGGRRGAWCSIIVPSTSELGVQCFVLSYSPGLHYPTVPKGSTASRGLGSTSLRVRNCGCLCGRGGSELEMCSAATLLCSAAGASFPLKVE